VYQHPATTNIYTLSLHDALPISNHDRARPAMRYDLKLFSGNANRPLAEEIAQYLSLPVSEAEISRFSDGEVFVQVNENVRGTDRSEEHTSELQSRGHLVCRLLLE